MCPVRSWNDVCRHSANARQERVSFSSIARLSSAWNLRRTSPDLGSMLWIDMAATSHKSQGLARCAFYLSVHKNAPGLSIYGGMEYLASTHHGTVFATPVSMLHRRSDRHRGREVPRRLRVLRQ